MHDALSTMSNREVARTLNTMSEKPAVLMLAHIRAVASRRATESLDAPTGRTHTTES